MAIKKSTINAYITALKKRGQHLNVSRTSSISYDKEERKYHELHYRPGAGLVPRARRISEKRAITQIKRAITNARKSKKYIPRRKGHRR